MAYPHYPIITNSKSNSFSKEDISKDLFFNMVNKTLIDIDKRLRALSNNLLPPLYTSEVLPIQCDNSLMALNEFLKTVRKLCSMAEKLPLSLSNQTNKYKISITLYYLEDQILVLYTLIRALRPICREEIDRRNNIQLEIHEQFGKILEISDQLAW